MGDHFHTKFENKYRRVFRDVVKPDEPESDNLPKWILWYDITMRETPNDEEASIQDDASKPAQVNIVFTMELPANDAEEARIALEAAADAGDLGAKLQTETRGITSR